MVRARSLHLVAFLALGWTACDGGSRPGEVALASTATAPHFVRRAGTAPAVAPATASAGAPVTSVPPAAAPGDPRAPAESAAEPVEIPGVEVENIGLHLAGADNDRTNKDPIRAAVATRFERLAQCWALAPDPPRAVTFGVDLHVDRGGGPPRVQHPRTELRGRAAVDCMVSVFEGLDMPAPRTRAPIVASYSLRFTRK
jgi:hypothetical protein